ncbi:hypothetical protein ATN84_24715 [Paramesorhizobium deserti]|uniref:Uncharacterized protein n=1 Tax=Paramesorhizobium deserti TaxID=1494590 RepID=A0A135HXK1_9HYPH|nr:hypothetical protein ATN84_24715 [Paramesorhizobium deserti]
MYETISAKNCIYRRENLSSNVSHSKEMVEWISFNGVLGNQFIYHVHAQVEFQFMCYFWNPGEVTTWGITKGANM